MSCIYLLAILFTYNAITASMPLDQTALHIIRLPVKRQTNPAEGAGGLSSLMSSFGNMQSGLSSLMHTMKDGKMVIGGFSFVVIPNPDVEQLQNLQSQLPSLPG